MNTYTIIYRSGPFRMTVTVEADSEEYAIMRGGMKRAELLRPYCLDDWFSIHIQDRRRWTRESIVS